MGDRANLRARIRRAAGLLRNSCHLDSSAPCTCPPPESESAHNCRRHGETPYLEVYQSSGDDRGEAILSVDIGQELLVVRGVGDPDYDAVATAEAVITLARDALELLEQIEAADDLEARLAVGLRSARAVLAAWSCPECLGGLCTACEGAGRRGDERCEACKGRGANPHVAGCELERFVEWPVSVPMGGVA